MGDTEYAQCGDLSIAYQVFGSGPVDIVFAGSFVSHIELFWGSPEIKAFFDHLGSFARVLIFDKAGVGLSDPVPKVRSIEDRAAELEAVMDAAGFDRAALMGLSEGGPAAIVYAASRPDRVGALVLMGTFPAVFVNGWDDIEAPPSVLRERAVAELGESYAPTEAQVVRLIGFGRAVRDNWGKGDALGILVPSVGSKLQRGLFERMCASPGMARATVEATFRVDVRDILPAVSVPTLVIHAKEDFLPIQTGRYLADHIPGATMVEVEGNDHAPWFTEPDRIVASIEHFLTGAQSAPASRRALRTILFTDIVGSTERAAAMGDERWHALIERYDELTRAAIERFGGRTVKNMGDGHLATLDGPAQAIRCAQAIGGAARSLGVDVRAGVHAGECELLGEDVGGLAVHIAARVMGAACASEIVVSSTVRDLVVGSGIGFEDRGTHELKGVPGSWQLLAVRQDGLAPGSDEARLVSQSTPSPHASMRRSDRAMGRIARRSPGVIRAMSRVLNRRPAEIPAGPQV